MTKLMQLIDGYKTYIVAASGVLVALAGFATGDLTLGEAVILALGGTGAATMKHAVAKTEKKSDA